MMGRMAHAVPTEAGAGTAVFTATVLDALTSANKPQVNVSLFLRQHVAPTFSLLQV